MPYTPEIIEKLKAVKEERGYSLQDIADMTEEAGCAVSLTTIKRVFSNNAKEQTFRYSKTIKPIADVLLDLDVAPGNDVKTDVLELLSRQIAAMDEERKKREQEYASREEYLKSRIERSDRIIRTLSIILGAILTVVIVVLLVDTFSPNIGWLRY